MQLLPFATLATLAAAAAAPETSDSPQDAKYQAVFNPNENYNINDAVRFSAYNNGSVWVQVDLKNFPDTKANQFPYHVHVAPVPEDGNCTATLGHLNPYNGSATASAPAEKEVGDLAGRHGNATGPQFHTTYVDLYLSLDPSDPAFIGNNRSVVVHDIDNKRLTCANIVQVFPNATGEHEAWNATSSVSLIAPTSSGSHSGSGSAEASATGSDGASESHSGKASGSASATASSGASNSGAMKVGGNIAAALTTVAVVALGSALL